jgi:Leucine-rich repeat (LRR) protein
MITVTDKYFATIPSNTSLGQNYTINNLQLIKNRIKSIEQYAFSGTQELVVLTLNNNFIADLSFLTISEMKTLKSLHIANNLLASIDPSWFTHTTSLTGLILSGNLLTALKTDSFVYLPKLETLFLSENSIETIQAYSFRGLTKLTFLNMKKNKIRILELYMTADLLAVSDEVELDNQNIHEIVPFSLAGFKKVTSLTMASNSLRALRNDSFNGMINLDELDLRNNKISEIQTGAFVGLPSLKILDLSSNLLNSTSHQLFTNLTRLESLLLQDNWINVVFNDSLKDLSIMHLNLANNNLQFLKNDYFTGLNKLKSLNLASNSISSIESGSFINMTGIRKLILSDNCIFKISPLLFQDQGMLDELFLDSNSLTNIEYIFTNLSSLTKLNLAYNSVFKLTNKTFQGLNSLTSLNLSSNFFKNLNESLTGLKSLKSIDLTNNRIAGETRKQFFSDLSFSNYEFYFRNTSIDLIKQIKWSRAYKLDLSFNKLFFNLPFNKMADTLIYLDLRSTSLNKFESDLLNQLEKLTHIDLSDNFITFRGIFLMNSMSLESIKLSNTNISNLIIEQNFDLSLFGSLALIDLSRNNLETIKTSYFNSIYFLSSLNLSYNFIKSIEAYAFPNYYLALELLDFTSNNLTSIPMDITYSGFISNCKFLAANNNIQSADLIYYVPILNISSNGLKKIPSGIESSKILDLSFNSVKSIKKENFAKSSSTLLSLFELYMISNLIETIEDNSFLKQNNLFVLDLSRNHLSKLGNDTFSGLFNLKILNLNYNSIQSVQASLFMQLYNLDKLYLNANPIKFIEHMSFINQNFLKILYLDSYDPSNWSNNSTNANSTLSNLTFVGLNNIRVLRLNGVVFSSLINLENINCNLKPIFDSKVLNTVYYKSRHVIYLNQDYTSQDCFVILYSVRSKIQVNMYDDKMMDQFMDFCGKFTLNQLSYSQNNL